MSEVVPKSGIGVAIDHLPQRFQAQIDGRQFATCRLIGSAHTSLQFWATRLGWIGLCLVLTLVTCGCSTKLGYLARSMTDPLKPHAYRFADGATSIYYRLNPDVTPSAMTLFFIPGSGCASLRYYLRAYLADLPESVQVYALQKRHVDDRDMGIGVCDADFASEDVFPQWAYDQTDFVRHISKQASLQGKPVVVLGVSEGGNTAAAVAASVPEVTHLAIIGSGGMTQIDELRLLFDRNHPGHQLDRAFAAVAADPDSIDQRAYGQTFRYWSSVAHVDPMRYYNHIDIPILLGIGERDTSTPVESAYLLRDRFAALGKSNLELLVYPDADHALTDARRGISYRPEFLRHLVQWALGKTDANAANRMGATQ